MDSSRVVPPRINKPCFRHRKVAVAIPHEDASKPHTHGSRGPSLQQKKKKNKPRKAQQQKNGGKPSRWKAEATPDDMAKIVALDCEMVGVGEGGFRSALARACIVNWSGEVVFDTYVKVEEPVTDYRTFVSGVREEHLASDDAITIDACRERVATILNGKVLVGHALKNDLQALGIRHPWQDTRDTAKYEPFMKTRFNDGVLWPRKLKDLTQEKLSKTIQVAGREHSPVEDAYAALELYKSARTKWEKVVEYKVKKTREILDQQQQQAATCA